MSARIMNEISGNAVSSVTFKSIKSRIALYMLRRHVLTWKYGTKLQVCKKKKKGKLVIREAIYVILHTETEILLD